MNFNEYFFFYDFTPLNPQKTLLVTPEEIAATLAKYEDRWKMAKPIDGTQSFHDYRCDESNDRYLFVRKISYAEEYQRVCVYKKTK